MRSPKLYATDFDCPRCGVHAHQDWFGCMAHRHYAPFMIEEINISKCSHCSEWALWLGNRLLDPSTRSYPAPNPDMGDNVRAIYEEAGAIASISPRGSAALLRLCVQMLCRELGEKGRNINDDISSLVRKGLPIDVQRALDVVRVVGNNAVHSGEIQPSEEDETAEALFLLVNVIVDKMITQPRQIETLYDTLPAGIRASIERRDGTRLIEQSPSQEAGAET